MPLRSVRIVGLAAVAGVVVLASAPADAVGAGGGAMFMPKPKVRKVTCIQRCGSRGRAHAGSTLRVTGSGLDAVSEVVFLGSYGRGDDAIARAQPGGSGRLLARVPLGAVTGPISLQGAGTRSSRASRSVAILPPPPPTPNVQLSPVPGPSDPGAPKIETGTSTTRAFYGAPRAVVFSYRIAAAAPVGVRIDLVSGRDGTVVQGWNPPPAQPGQIGSVAWSGSLGRGAAAPGRYFFSLTASGSNGAVARSAQNVDLQRDAFDLFDHIFPIRGSHAYGGGAGRFGARRRGHTHQGQDVFARCGTALVAARGGRVKAKAFQRLAGNYLVIDGAGTDVDYGYMHLAEPSPFSRGDRVYTGQRIGSVGKTGDAKGCHLHFEMWAGPGWYSGGRPFDPLSALKAWDGWS